MVDFVWSDGVCPACRTRGARLAPWFKVKCRKPSCPNFDQELQNRPAAAPAARASAPRAGTSSPPPA